MIGCTRPQSLRSKVDLRSPEKRTEKYPEKYRYVGDGLPICHRQNVSRSHQTLPARIIALFNLQGVSPKRKGREKQRVAAREKLLKASATDNFQDGRRMLAARSAVSDRKRPRR